MPRGKILRGSKRDTTKVIVVCTLNEVLGLVSGGHYTYGWGNCRACKWHKGEKSKYECKILVLLLEGTKLWATKPSSQSCHPELREHGKLENYSPSSFLG